MNKSPEPWKRSFTERCNVILDKSFERKVIFISDKPAGSFRYRVYNICQALESSKIWRGTYFLETELTRLDEVLSQVSLIVFSRTEWKSETAQLVQKAKTMGISTVFDVDDLIFDLEKIPLLMSSLGVAELPKSYDYWFSLISRQWLMGQSCDFTLGTNAYICKHLQRVFKKDSFVIDNFLNRDQLDVSEKIIKDKLKNKSSDSFKIGYFSGSPSHRNDFKKCSTEIAHFLAKYPTSTLEVVGYMDFPAELKGYIQKQRVTHSPFVDFLTLQKKIAAVDVNIAPLSDNEFSNCKSELKFFEAAIVGTITCATPTYAFKNSIVDSKTGFLCREGDWHKALEKIYHQDRTEKIVEEAKRYCLYRYSPQHQCLSVEKTFDSILVKGKSS